MELEPLLECGQGCSAAFISFSLGQFALQMLMLQLLEGCRQEMGISRSLNSSDADLDLCEHPALRT